VTDERPPESSPAEEADPRVCDPPAMSPATAWYESFMAAVGAYTETRGEPPAVRVTVGPDHERLLLHSAAAGPGDNLVTFDPYPEDEEDMIRREDESFVTPRVVLVHPNSISKIEFLFEVPGGRGEMGFRAGGGRFA